MPQRNHEVLPLRENVKVLDLIRKGQKLYAEVSKIYCLDVLRATKNEHPDMSSQLLDSVGLQAGYLAPISQETKVAGLLSLFSVIHEFTERSARP